ncbi:uncharacterized protein [Periplaneta americana]|uniref:uncharacterized protein n=1 Tax=Periplaneta americana TaxID=6978 RepID=UPI0037E95B32
MCYQRYILHYQLIQPQTITKNSKEPALEIQQASHPRSHQSGLLLASDHAGDPSAEPLWNPSQKHAPSEPGFTLTWITETAMTSDSIMVAWTRCLEANGNITCITTHCCTNLLGCIKL